MRKRLTKTEALALGFVPREADEHGNPQYNINSEQWTDVLDMREEFGFHGNTVSQLKTKFGTNKAVGGAKILVFDIETAPSLAYTWGKWQQNIHDEQLINDWFMFTWSAKWLFEKEIYNAKLTSQEAIDQDDKRITYSIWKLLDEADIVIGHNIKKFDIKKLNARFLIHGFGTPSSYEIIDTLLHARKSFAVHSNKLDYLANVLGVGSKVNHEGFSMWKKCYNGDEEALTKMAEYNDGDIKINEEVYLEIRPFIKPHPNLGLFINDDISRCPCCGSDQLDPTGDYYTTTNTYPEYKCKSCGSNSRGRKANKRGKGIMSSLPR